MSTQTQVLDGNRLYGQVTYSDNNDPQTLTASLGDSTAMAETDIFSGAKPLSDSATLSDAIAKLLSTILADTSTLTEARILEAIKALSDTATLVDARAFATNRTVTDILASMDAQIMAAGKVLSEITTSSPNLYSQTQYGSHLYSGDFTALNIFMRDGIVKQVSKLLFEALSIEDSTVAIHQTKGFTEFVVLQSWLRLDLRRANIWTETSGSAVVENSLTLYDQSLYASSKLYAASPKVIWAHGNADLTVWQKAAEIVSLPTLFAQSLYGVPLYSSKPEVFWTKPVRSSQNWTNEDGQNNQES